MGNNKRKHKDKEENIRRKIRKLEEKLKKPRRRILVFSSSEDESSNTDVTQMECRAPRSISPLTLSPRNEPVARQAPIAEQFTSAAAEPLSTLEISTPREEIEEMEPSQMELDENILSLLGEAPKSQTPLGKNIHEAISSRWLEVLSKGLTKDSKDKINQEYLVPGNCELLVAPILNPETKAAMTDFMVKRDQSLLQRQQQLGIALAALAQATESVIAKEAPEKVLKPLSDACRILCDNHFQDTKTRRSLVISSVKPDLRDTLVNTARDKYLFGEKLTDQIKSAQNIQKSGEGLKIPSKQPFNKKQFVKNNVNNTPKNRLNYKALHRQAPRAEAGRFQQTQRPTTRNNRPQNQQYQGRPRSPAPRTSYRK